MDNHVFNLQRPSYDDISQTVTAEEIFALVRPFEPLPKPTGKAPFHLDLKSVLPPSTYQNIIDTQKMVFHCMGDTGGVKHPVPQKIVADHLEGQFVAGSKTNASFFYHLGDVVYYYGAVSEYGNQFYDPYLHYPAPIFAIPGNHDGDIDPHDIAPSLDGFVKFFCASKPMHPAEAGDAPRTTMVQPNVYWTLITPYATFIGLYTNVPEGGVIQDDQKKWFTGELKTALQEKEKNGKAIIVSLHHPVYSMDTFHSGSVAMQSFLDGAFTETHVYPDLVFGAHVHNYQRYTRTLNGRQIPYIVAGAGGYWNLHQMDKTKLAISNMAVEQAFTSPYPNVVLENYCDDRHGFLRITIDKAKNKLIGEYFTVPRPQESWKQKEKLLDLFELDLTAHKVKTGKVI